MTELSFPAATGSVSRVPADAYEDIVCSYVASIERLDSILGVVQIGSTSVPGLSDIDLMVVFRDEGPFPDWVDVSLIHSARLHPHRDVVFHDVFVIPESVYRRLGAFFYVDAMQLRLDNGLPEPDYLENRLCLREMITLEYAIHKFDALMSILLRPTVSVRELALFISTLRHTVLLGSEIGVCGRDQADTIVADIEEMRQEVVNGAGNYDFGPLLQPVITMPWYLIQELGRRLTSTGISDLPSTWHSHLRTGVIDIEDASEPIPVWQALVKRQKSSRLKKYVKVIPVPVEAHRHVASYFEPANALAQVFPDEFRRIGVCIDDNSPRVRARRLRGSVACDHWEFLARSGYVRSSGKAYVGLSMPGTTTVRSRAYSVLRRLQTLRCARLGIVRHSDHR